MTDADRYEIAVYEEDAHEAAKAVLDALAPVLRISDERVRAGMIAAALMSAAEYIDGMKRGEVLKGMLQIISDERYGKR